MQNEKPKTSSRLVKKHQVCSPSRSQGIQSKYFKYISLIFFNQILKIFIFQNVFLLFLNLESFGGFFATLKSTDCVNEDATLKFGKRIQQFFFCFHQTNTCQKF